MPYFRRWALTFALFVALVSCDGSDSPHNGFAAYAGAGNTDGASLPNGGNTEASPTGGSSGSNIGVSSEDGGIANASRADGSGIGSGGSAAVVSSEGGIWSVKEAGGQDVVAMDGETAVDASQPIDGALDPDSGTTTMGDIDAGVQPGIDATQVKDGSASVYYPCPTDGTVCKIMPFGDSITDGYNWDTPGGYRVELFRLAHSAGKKMTFVGSSSNGPATVDGVDFPNNHEGHSGWTIDPVGGRSGISTLVSTVMPQYEPHIVLLMIGTNDAIDDYDMANAPTRLGELIDSIYALLPDVLIVVAQLIPSRGDASQGDDTDLSTRINRFNDAIPAVVKTRADEGKHILLVDMYTPFNPNKASLLEDQWHPNLAGYVLIAEQWYATIESLL